MTKGKHVLCSAAAQLVAGAALAAGADLGQVQKQATNWTAIAMFAIFVGITLWITRWAATCSWVSSPPWPSPRFRRWWRV